MNQARAGALPSAGALPVSLIVWGALGVALNVGLARFTYGVMLPSLRRDLGLDYLGGGSLNAVHLAGYLIGTLAAPWLGRRLGMPRLSRHAHLVVAAGALLCAAAPPNAVWGSLVLGVGRLATGLGAGAGIVAILVLVFAAVSAARRPLVSAVVWAGMGAAVVVSALAVPVLLDTSFGWRCAFLVSAALALAVALSFPPKRMRSGVNAAAPAAPSADVARMILSPQWLFLIAGYFMFGVAYIAYSTFAGARLAAAAAPNAVIAATWSAFGIAAMVGAALTVPVLGSQRAKRFALIAALVSGALGALLAAFSTAAAALAGALLVGLGIAATPTIVSAHARDRCSANDYPKVFSFASAALGAGQLVGPVAGGALADVFGTAAVPLFAAAAYLLAALFAACDAAVADRTQR